jgi:ABC-type Na+ efflux pump permease subunit
MYKLFVIAHREYVAMVGTKAFLFTLVMMPILMFGSIVAMPLINSVSGSKTLKIVVADGTAQLFETIDKAATQRNESLKMLSKKDTEGEDKKLSGRDSKDSFMNQEADIWLFTEAPNELTDEQRLEYSRQIRNGDLYALVEIPKSLWDDPSKLGVDDAVENTGLENTGPERTGNTPIVAPKIVAPKIVAPKFYSQDALISGTRSWLGFFISQKMRELRIRQFGLTSITPEVFSQIDAKVELTPNMPIQASDIGKSKDQSPMDSLFAMFLPFGVMMLMFMVILMAAQPMLESAMEEKSLRISEVLLGSVTPSQLMGGKLIGNVAGSLVIFVLYGSGGLFLLNSQGLSDKIPASVLPWFLLFQLLGVLFFSSIFLTVGASVNELKEAQTMLLPVWMVLMAPMMVWFVAVRDPNGVVATTLSFFPPSCPMMMVLRLASGTTVPFWQPPLAAIIMLVSTFLIVRTAGRIYRAGLLRNEGARSITQLLRRSVAPR